MPCRPCSPFAQSFDCLQGCTALLRTLATCGTSVLIRNLEMQIYTETDLWTGEPGGHKALMAWCVQQLVADRLVEQSKFAGTNPGVYLVLGEGVSREMAQCDEETARHTRTWNVAMGR